MASETAERPTAAYEIEFLTDPAAFLAVARPHLAADPVGTTVMATVTSHLRDERAAGHARPVDRPEWWAVVRDGGDVAGLAMRTAYMAPNPMFLLPMPDPAARALAAAVHARGELVGGVNGSLPAAQVCAGELARLQGGQVEVAQHTRLFELGELRPPEGVPGRLRAATLDDLDLAAEWLDRFLVDADAQAGRAPTAHEPGDPADVRRRIEQGTYWFWLDEDGHRVHLTGANPPAFGVARIGPVYTPQPQRRKGFAGAAVAAVSRRLRDAGVRVCLYTDQANPTSNDIYEAIGFRPVVDQANLVIVAAARPVFVLHEHDRPRHHFDLRLEEDGVLRSWAVPKGLPEDPAHNRLAVPVADHEMEHAGYEDATKRIADSGWWELEDRDERRFVFVLHGRTAARRYALISTGTDALLHLVRDQPE
jgi:DNA ligase D-like protein (predicted 3'-phosphoesterase)